MSRFLASLALVFLTGSVALADGKMFVGGEAQVRIPDQSALICFDGETENLVIETAFEGEGSDFAWVVPVPSMPEVEAATSGLFPTLRMITRPRVIGYNEDWWGVVVIAASFGVLIWLGTLLRRSGEFLALGILGLLLAGLLLPAMGRAGVEGRGVGSTVSIHDRKTVGAYETITLSGPDGRALADWLNGNGYIVPESVRPVIEQYAKEGWFFVASRLRREAESGRAATHPLSFTFKTDRAIYPLRLTGVDNGPVTIDLYVAGDKEATAEHFQRRRAAQLDFSTDASLSPAHRGRQRERDKWLPIAHDGLKRYTQGLGALTLLSGTLAPNDMLEDVYLDWKPLTPYRQVLRLRQSAMALAAHWAVGTFTAIALICAVVYSRKRKRRPATPRIPFVRFAFAIGVLGFIGGAVLLLFGAFVISGLLMFLSGITLFIHGKRLVAFEEARREALHAAEAVRRPAITVLATALILPMIVGAVIYAATPKFSSDSVVSRRVLDPAWLHDSVAEEISIPSDEVDSAKLLDAVRQQAVEQWKKHVQAGTPYSHLPLKPMAEEDSPGNYTIELHDGKPAYFRYDMDGRKVLVRVFGGDEMREDLSEY